LNPQERGPPTLQNLASLIELVKLGAGTSYAEVSSGRLGKGLDLTQQAASKRLIDLEKAGLISRVHSGRGLKVKLTPDGLRAVRTFYRGLKGALDEGPAFLVFRGTLFTGLREGGYYVSLGGYARPFRSTLGFIPYPGTLNLRLTDPAMVEERRRLNLAEGVEIPGFEDTKRTYGPVKCFRAQIGDRYPAAVLAIERTHYDDTVLEVISPLNLRKTLKLRDGDECEVTAYLEQSRGPPK
jgi:riboflavin kinase